MNKANIEQAINRELKIPIAVLIDKRFYRAAMVLMFSGIDTMGNLMRQEGKEENDSADFKAWISRYFKMQGIHETEVTLDEWWSARNALLHTQSAFSRDVRLGKCRVINWINGLSNPTIRFNALIDPSQVVVNINIFAEAFFVGVDQSLSDLFGGPLAAIADDRLKNLYINVPIQQ